MQSNRKKSDWMPQYIYKLHKSILTIYNTSIIIFSITGLHLRLHLRHPHRLHPPHRSLNKRLDLKTFRNIPLSPPPPPGASPFSRVFAA